MAQQNLWFFDRRKGFCTLGREPRPKRAFKTHQTLVIYLLQAVVLWSFLATQSYLATHHGRPWNHGVS